MIKYLTFDDVLFVYNIAIDMYGGERGLLNENSLKAAVGRPQQSFGGVDLYTTLFSKAAALGHSIINNHPFIDGNKRTGMASMDLFLDKNNFILTATDDECEKFILEALENKYDVEYIACWIEKYSKLK